MASYSRSILPRLPCIKNLLMNQKVLAGIGNIYADEILFLMGMHPKKKRGFEKRRVQAACRKNMPCPEDGN